MNKTNSQRGRGRGAKGEKQTEEQAKADAALKQQQDEEAKQLQEAQDLQEFQAAPRVNLQLKAAYGINDNLVVNGTKMGTAFQFLQTPGGAVSGKPTDDVQLLYPVGRQVAVRDTATNRIWMLPNENASHRVTAVAAHFSGESSRIAMAEQDFHDPSLLYFSVFEITEGNNIRVLTPRIRIDVPEEEVASPRAAMEESKTRTAANGNLYGAGQGRQHAEFSSAAASSPGIPRRDTLQGSSKTPETPGMPFVSQICFSNNFVYVACLVSGPVNRVVVYEAKAAKVNRPVASETFTMLQVQPGDDAILSPTQGDQSRFTDKSRMSTRTVYHQPVTQISFNPIHALSLCMTGPNARLDYRKIIVGRQELEPQHGGKFEEMRELIGGETITGHAWSADGMYFGICTEYGQIVVYKVGSEIVLHESFGPGDSSDEADIVTRLVGIQIFEIGMVVASSDGHLLFFDLGAEDEFREIRRWQYKSEQPQELVGEMDIPDVVRGVQVLDTDRKMLAVQLSNRNVLIIDMWAEVYLQDKRDDIAMKLQEHETLLASEEEQSRYSQMSAVDKGKAREARANEREEILAIGYKIVGSGFHSGEITEMHTCLQRPVLLTMSHEDQTVRLWNYADNTCELEQNFAAGLGGQKPLVSCALHPSGYYMAVGLHDQLRLYHILHPGLKEFRVYDQQKNTKRVRFSSGGQYFCAIDHKNVHVFSTYSLERVRNLQIPPNTMSTISFNFNDSRLAFVSEDGAMQRFDLEDFQKLGDLRNNRAFSYKSAVFVSHDDPEDGRLITVGQEREVGASLGIFDAEDETGRLQIKDEFGEGHPALGFNDILKVVSPDNLVENLVVGTNRGSIIVYGMPRFLREDPQFQYGQTVAHYGELTALATSVDGKYVFSAGQDGIIFVYDVLEHTPQTKRGYGMMSSQVHQASVVETGTIGTNSIQDRDHSIDFAATTEQPAPPLKSAAANSNNNQNNASRISKRGIEVQDELARIVLVGKNLMEDWRKEQQTLWNDMAKQQDLVDSSLRAENFSFIQQNNRMEKAKTQQLNALNQKYEQLQMEEAEQKDENQQQMNKLEINHNQCKEELQDLYEKKLEYEQEQLKRLKEDQGEDKRFFENEIKRLNDRHDEDVEELLDLFKKDLQHEQGEYEDSKKKADDLKMKNEEKLTSQEADFQEESNEMTEKFNTIIARQWDQISELKNNIEREKYHKLKIEAEITELAKKTERIQHITAKLQEKGRQHEVKIKDLDQDKKDATQNLKKKEDELFQQKFKIKDLQKTKQVLTHRTFEMKASLEPKEQQIESLKQNLHDLEKLFDMQAKSLKQMKKNVKSKKDAIETLEKNKKQAKTLTKRKELKINEFVVDLQNTMQFSDDADKLQSFMQIYRNHVADKASEEVISKKQKDPELIDQLDKHLKYMEKQIRQLQDTSSKNLKKAKDHIHTRTEENKDLIIALTGLREKDHDRQKKQYTVDKKITEINLSKRRINTEIEKMQEEMQKMKLRQSSGPGLHKASSVYNNKKDEDNRVADQFRRNQSRGRLIKGSLFNNRPAGMYKQQIQELLAQLDEANETIVLQNLQITTLRDEYEAARRDIQEADGGAAQHPTEAQANQYNQLRSELENMQIISDKSDLQRRAQYMQQQMVAAGEMEAQNQGVNGQAQVQRQDIDGQPM